MKQLTPVRKASNTPRVSDLACPPLAADRQTLVFARPEDLSTCGRVLIDDADVVLEHPGRMSRDDEEGASAAGEVTQAFRRRHDARHRALGIDPIVTGDVSDVAWAPRELRHERENLLGTEALK